MDNKQYIDETIEILHNISAKEITYERALRIRDILEGFSIGDKVRVRRDPVVDQVYGENIFVDEMVPYLGKEYTIVGYYLDDDKYFPDSISGYQLDNGDTFFIWTREMLEKI